MKRRGFNLMKLIRNPKNIILIILALASAVLCIVLPEKLIKNEGIESIGVALDVPEEYYPTSSYYEVLKESSDRLTDYQKRQLISGIWESEISEVDEEYYESTGYHMETEAKSIISNFNNAGAYPVLIDSSYNQWYNWKCTYMQALDSNFRSYAGFFWKVVFTHYQNDETLTVYMTSDGLPIKLLYKAGSENAGEESDDSNIEKQEPLPIDKFDDDKFKELAYLMSGAFVLDGADGNYNEYQSVIILDEAVQDVIVHSMQLVDSTDEEFGEGKETIYYDDLNDESDKKAIIKVRMGINRSMEVKEVRTTSENEKRQLIDYLNRDKLVDGNLNGEEKKTGLDDSDQKEDLKENMPPGIKAENLNDRIITVVETTGTSTEKSESEYYIYVYQETDRYMIGLVPVE